MNVPFSLRLPIMHNRGEVNVVSSERAFPCVILGAMRYTPRRARSPRLAMDVT